MHKAALDCFDKLAEAGAGKREAFEAVLLNLLIEAVLAAQAAQISTSDFQILSGVAQREAAKATGTSLRGEDLDALVCELADAWASVMPDRPYGLRASIRKPLDALESATRGSPLRKVKP